MAINIPIVTEFVDAGLKSAQGAFDNFRTKVSEAEGGLGKFKAGMNASFDAVKANAGAFAAVVGGALVAVAGKAISAASDFEESTAKIGEVFGEASDAVMEFADGAAQTLGQSKQDVLDAAGTFGTFGKAAGLANDDLSQFTIDFTTLASDLASFNNTTPEDAVMALGAALRGENEPLRRYGILLDDATLKQEALALGLINTTNQALTPQQKVLAAQSAIFKQSSDAQGDFARTSDSLANQQRILKAELENTAIEIGQKLLPVAVDFAKFANDTLVPALKGVLDVLLPVLEVLSKFTGTLDQGLAETIEKAQTMGKSMSDIARELGANDEQSLNYMASVLGITLDELYEQLDRDLIPETYFLEQAWKEGTQAMIEAYDTTVDLTRGFVSVEDALKELKGEIDERQAWRNLIDVLDQAKDAAIQAFAEATPDSLRQSEASLDQARLKVGEYIASIDSIPEEQKSEFIAMLDQAKIDQIESILAYLARAREVQFMPVLPPGMGGIGEIGSGGRPIGETPISLGRGNRMAAGGVTVNVAGSVVTERDLVNTVRKGLIDSQRNGAPLVYSNS
jgi:hypothetical protein